LLRLREGREKKSENKVTEGETQFAASVEKKKEEEDHPAEKRKGSRLLANGRKIAGIAWAQGGKWSRKN